MTLERLIEILRNYVRRIIQGYRLIIVSLFPSVYPELRLQDHYHPNLNIRTKQVKKLKFRSFNSLHNLRLQTWNQPSLFLSGRPGQFYDFRIWKLWS